MSLPDRPAGALLDAAIEAPTVTLDELAPPGGLLIVAPHPDDETFGCGEALAAASRAGREIGLLLLTDGEASHPGSPTYDRKRLSELRQNELRQALQALAPDRKIDLLQVGLEDGQSGIRHLQAHQIGEILAFARNLKARSVWTTWEGDPHCDHVTAARLARIVADKVDARLWTFPVWGRFGDRPVPDDLRLFADRQFRSHKAKAVAAYRSQTTRLIDDDPHGFVMPGAFVEHFKNHPEIFIRER